DVEERFLRDEADSVLTYTKWSAIVHDLGYLLNIEHRKGTYRVLAQLLEFADKLEELDKRTLTHRSMIEMLEAAVYVRGKKEGEIEAQQKWPSYASEDFEKIVENSTGLDNAGENKSQILYHIMELEALLGKVEKKARVTNRKYESRLAASLRDICRVHEPSEISEEQIKRFTACVRALIEGWGKLNREKVKWIRNRLLEVGLTWLPITDKATKDVSGAKTLTE
ncbi:hypothetical protein KA005_47020, partial [bacterium]|nr:hypothetical protein [bacterium]